MQCKATSKRSGSQCKNHTSRNGQTCRIHGGGLDSGRPIEHALYSKRVPTAWQPDYEYFESDPDYLSLRGEIALAQTNMSRFLDLCKGIIFSADMREHIIAHLAHIGKLKEQEAKRIYQESVVRELLRSQVVAEAAILQRVLSHYVDAATAERAAAEFADLVQENAGVGASVSV